MDAESLAAVVLRLVAVLLRAVANPAHRAGWDVALGGVSVWQPVVE